MKNVAKDKEKEKKMAAMNDFGDYELIETMENPNLNNDHKLGRFRCKICGREKVTTISSMKNSKTKSHKFCILQVNPDKHFRGIFASMKTRCNNPNVEKYKNYGGRGIKCDYEYLIDFYDDFYEEYLEHVAKHGISNTTVERKDVNKGYTKDNITFATLQEQARNKTNLTPVMVTNNETGEKLYFSCAPEAAERLGVSSSLVYHRIYSEDTQNQNPYNGYVFERMDEFKLIKPIIHEDRELIKPFYFEEY